MKYRKMNDAHGKMADHHLALHGHHVALANLHKGDAADLHEGIAEHHLGLAGAHNEMHEHFKSLADAEEGEGAEAGKKADAEPAEKKPKAAAKERAVGPRPPKMKPFGSLSGAGHQEGVVDSVNSGGTNSV